MRTVATRFANLEITHRCAVYWLAALVAGLILGSVIGDGVTKIFFIVLFVPGVAIAASALIVAGFASAAKRRREPVRALATASAPFAAIAIGALATIFIWSIRGVPPLVNVGTGDFRIDQTLISPDGRLRAVSLEDLSGGPATGVSQDVYIERGSTSFFRYRDRVFSEECIQNFAARWIGPRTLRVSYTVGYGGSNHDGVDRPPIWVWSAAAREVNVVAVRTIIRKQSLC
jgi:hypothetical protein